MASPKNLRWVVVNDAAVAVEGAEEAVAAYAKENADVQWRLPSFEEAVAALDSEGKFQAFDAAIRGVWCQESRGLDTQAPEFAADAKAELSVVAVADVKQGRPATKSQNKFTVMGYIDNPTYQQCVEAAQFLNTEYPKEYKINVKRTFAFEFEKAREQLLADGKITDNYRVVVVDEETDTHYDGDAFIKMIVNKTDFRLFDAPEDDPQSYRSLAQTNLRGFLRESGSKYVWMVIKIGDMVQGRIVFQLYSKELPRTSENFLHLCRGDLPDANVNGNEVKLSYKGKRFFRVVKNGWIQAGDIEQDTGNGGTSIYGQTFPDEGFGVKHDGAGILGMASNGEHTNSSGFYITVGKSQWMDGRYVAFGRVVEGLHVVHAIHAVETKHSQAPAVPVVIQDCGHISLD